MYKLYLICNDGLTSESASANVAFVQIANDVQHDAKEEQVDKSKQSMHKYLKYEINTKTFKLCKFT